MEIKDKQAISSLLTRNIEISNRFNCAIEQILRKGNSKEEVTDLISSIRYLADDMERVLNR